MYEKTGDKLCLCILSWITGMALLQPLVQLTLPLTAPKVLLSNGFTGCIKRLQSGSGIFAYSDSGSTNILVLYDHVLKYSAQVKICGKKSCRTIYPALFPSSLKLRQF